MGLNVSVGFQDIRRELLLEIDKTGNILNISSNCYNILGYEQNEMIGSNLNKYADDNIGEIDVKCSNNFEIKLKSKEGTIRFYDGLVSSNNNSNGAKISLIDISKYKKVEESEKRFKTMLENTHDVIYLYEIIPQKKFVYINHAVEELLGITVEEAYEDAMFPFKIVHPDDLPVQYKKINGATNFKKPMEMRLRDKKGKYVWFEDYVIPFYNSAGELEAISGFNRVISDRKELERKLEELSYYDSLTRLFSSNYYHKQEKRLNELYDSSIGVIIGDLDNLKKINDSLGHAGGDRLLINFGNLLKREVNTDTVVARYGGDEFVILMENTSEENVKKLYFGLKQSIKEFNKINQTMPIEVSIGWAYSPTSLGVVEKIFKIADDMMYENKFNKKKSS